MANTVQITVTPLEVATGNDAANVDITQQTLEVTSSDDSCNVVISQNVLEVVSQIVPPTNVLITHEPLEVISGDEPNPVIISQQVLEVFSRNIVEPCSSPDTTETFTSEMQGPVIWVEWNAGDQVRPYGEIELPDPTSYHYGYKEPRLLELSDCRRTLSGNYGDYEVSSFNFRLADTDRSLRSILATAPGRYFNKHYCEAFLISDTGRRTHAIPQKIAAGFVAEQPSFDSLSVQFGCKDFIGSGLGWNMETQVPKRLIEYACFPKCPPANLKKGIPIIYGILSDERDPTTPPTLSTVDHGGTTPPQMLALNQGLGIPVDCNGAHAENNGTLTYYRWVCVTSVNGANEESNPSNWGDVHGDTGGGLGPGQIGAWICWSASPDPAVVKYRAYMFNIPYFHPQNHPNDTPWGGNMGTTPVCRYVEKTVASGENGGFPGAPWGVVIHSDTDGSDYLNGTVITPTATHEYAVTAMIDGNETEISNVVIGKAYAGFPTIELSWTAVVSASSYRVYRREVGMTQWEKLQETNNLTLNDDGNNWSTITGIKVPHGTVGLIYTGQQTLGDNTTWHRFLLCGHAIDSIDHWYYLPPNWTEETNGDNPLEKDLGEGTDWLIPGYAGWNAKFLNTYIDVESSDIDLGTDGHYNRCTIIYGKVGNEKPDAVAAGSARLQLNLRGIEDVGNGSGEVITDLYLQAKHFLNYWVIGNYTGPTTAQPGGAWGLPRTFPNTSICYVNSPSFCALSALRKTEITGGYTGGGVIGNDGDLITVSEALKWWCNSGEFRIGPNRHWQIIAAAIDDKHDSSNDPELIDIYDIQKTSFSVDMKLDELANVVVHNYAYRWAAKEWVAADAAILDAASVAGYGVNRSQTLDLYFLRSGAVAAAAMTHRLHRTAYTPTYITIEGNLCLTNYDVGDYITLTHFQGIGSEGYVKEPLWIIGHSVLPKKRGVRLECLSLKDIIPNYVHAEIAGRTNITVAPTSSTSFVNSGS